MKTRRTVSKTRDTYKYQVKVSGKIIYRGITKDLDRRGAEHKARWPSSHIVQVGRRTTRDKALGWEKRGGKR